jgi:hypothetical protein
MWWVLAESVVSLSGSKSTRSPSEPTATVPFFGQRPNIFAGFVATISTNQLAVVAWREVPAHAQDLGRHEVEVVEEPFRRGGDELLLVHVVVMLS